MVIKLQILTKFYSVDPKVIDNVFFKTFIAINKVLSFLRIQAKKIKRKKYIENEWLVITIIIIRNI